MNGRDESIGDSTDGLIKVRLAGKDVDCRLR